MTNSQQAQQNGSSTTTTTVNSTVPTGPNSIPVVTTTLVSSKELLTLKQNYIDPSLKSISVPRALSSKTCGPNGIFIRTPLIESVVLKKFAAERPVYLKMENCQPSGSFKLRGLSNLCKYAKSQGFERFVCPSGGNAGLATAYSARKLNMPCHIVVNNQTPLNTRETIRAFGASVEVFGESVTDSVYRAQSLAKEDPKMFLIHPFDHQAIWDGHSTIMDEIVEELDQEPSVIVTCCGGGGLINGLVQGCRRYGWTSTKILAMEATGCHSFNISVQNNGIRKKLDKITSQVVCLCLDEVCQEIMDGYHEARPPILSRVVNDRDAADGCLKFAEDHRVLVGLACGTCLAALYQGLVEKIILGKETEQETMYDKYPLDINGNRLNGDNGGPVVVIVCGGWEISLGHIQKYKNQFNL